MKNIKIIFLGFILLNVSFIFCVLYFEDEEIEKDGSGFLNLYLMNAVKSGQLYRVKELFDAGVDINFKSTAGLTPIIMASFLGYRNIVEFLISKGAQLDIKDQDGRTALIYASIYGRISIANILVKAGAKVNIQDNQGCTAFMYAYLYERQDIIILLILSDADTGIKDNNGYTADYYLLFRDEDGFKFALDRSSKNLMQDLNKVIENYKKRKK